MKSKKPKTEDKIIPESERTDIANQHTYEADLETTKEYFEMKSIENAGFLPKLLISMPLILGFPSCVRLVNNEISHPECKLCLFGHKIADLNLNPACETVFKNRRDEKCRK